MEGWVVLLDFSISPNQFPRYFIKYSRGRKGSSVLKTPKSGFSKIPVFVDDRKGSGQCGEEARKGMGKGRLRRAEETYNFLFLFTPHLCPNKLLVHGWVTTSAWPASTWPSTTPHTHTSTGGCRPPSRWAASPPPTLPHRPSKLTALSLPGEQLSYCPEHFSILIKCHLNSIIFRWKVRYFLNYL